MSEWKSVKLEDIFELQMGKTPSRDNSNYWIGGTNKWVSIADIGNSDKFIFSTKEYITDLAVKESGIRPVPVNTVVMSFKLSLGKTCITSEKMFTNEAIMAFIDKKEHSVNNDFIYHLFRWKNWSKGTNKAVMGVTLNKKSLGNHEIPLPPLEIQEKIASTLDKVSELLALRRKQLEELDVLIQAIFYEMFGDPVLNEKGWQMKELKIFGKIITGNSPPRTDINNYFPPFIEWIKTDNINENELFVTEAVEYLSESGLSKGRVAVPKSLLVTCIAGSMRSIGRAALTNRIVSFNQQINAIQPNESIDPFFLYWLIKMSKKVIQNNTEDGMKKILTKGKMEQIKFILPPFQIQIHFSIFAQKIEEQKQLILTSINETQLLFDSLMSEYFEFGDVN